MDMAGAEVHGQTVVIGQGVMVLNQKGGQFRLGIRKLFFTLRMVKPWHRVSREAAAAPGFLEVPKDRLDGAWSTVV